MMDRRSAMLQLVDVSKSFGRFPAVTAMSLSVGQGELCALIGPNGAGKTTLINVITGHFLPDGGKVLFNNRSIVGLPPHRVCQAGIARSFQITSIFPRLSVFENVQIALMTRRGKCRDAVTPARRVLRDEVYVLLDYVRMVARAGDAADELAAGDRKLLEFAMALAAEPQLMVLDEPTAGMGPAEKVLVMDILRDMNERRGIAVLFTEHDLDVVFAIAQKIIVMHQGRKVTEGLPQEVRDNARVQEIYLGEHVHADA